MGPRKQWGRTKPGSKDACGAHCSEQRSSIPSREGADMFHGRVKVSLCGAHFSPDVCSLVSVCCIVSSQCLKMNQVIPVRGKKMYFLINGSETTRKALKKR